MCVCLEVCVCLKEVCVFGGWGLYACGAGDDRICVEVGWYRTLTQITK